MLADLPYTLLTIFGIGLVIFVHELGHYWAARSVGIRVDAFSIGFGPRLFGWKSGTCDWKLCLIPLGGYVKMAGEDPTNPTTGRDDEFGSKTVGQRVLVISAGVIMNVIFALVTIPILFAIGIPFPVPELGGVAYGSPADRAGLKRGDRILEIDGRQVLGFLDIPQDIAAGGEEVAITYLRDGNRKTVTVRPRDEGQGYPTIGVYGVPPEHLPLKEETFARTDLSPAAAKVLAALKEGGVRPGDRLIALNGIPVDEFNRIHASRAELSPVPIVATFAGAGREVIVTLDGALVSPTEDQEPLTGARVGLRVGRSLEQTLADSEWGPGVSVTTIPVETSQSLKDLVNSLGEVSRAVEEGKDPSELFPSSVGFGLQSGDELLAIGETRIESPSDLIAALGEGRDPTVLPPLHKMASAQVLLLIARAGKNLALTLDLPTATDRIQFLRNLPLEPSKEIRVFYEGGALYAAGARTGDVVMDGSGKAMTIEALRKLIDDAGKSKSVSLQLRRQDGTTLSLSVKPGPILVNGASLGLSELLEVRVRTEVVQKGAIESIKMGVLMTQRFGERIINTLRSIFSGRVEARQLGGIITIFEGTKVQSKISILQGFLFLAMISINLAILNILPIPVLDGGWLMFLLIEKIQGRPIGPKTMAILQYAGLALIGALMIYVTRNDVMRLMGWM